MNAEKISIKLLKAEKGKLTSKINELTGKNDELQSQIDENQIDLVNLTAEKTQIQEDIQTLKGE